MKPLKILWKKSICGSLSLLEHHRVYMAYKVPEDVPAASRGQCCDNGHREPLPVFPFHGLNLEVPVKSLHVVEQGKRGGREIKWQVRTHCKSHQGTAYFLEEMMQSVIIRLYNCMHTVTFVTKWEEVIPDGQEHDLQLS